MPTGERVHETRSTLGRKFFGVWGVRDYYIKLEHNLVNRVGSDSAN